MIINSQEQKFQLDCGATVNVLPVADYVKLFDDKNLTEIEESKTSLLIYEQSQVTPLGKRTIRVVNPPNSKKYTLVFQIVKQGSRPVIGARAVQLMDLITINTQNISTVESKKNSSEELLDRYSDVFQGEGTLPGKLTLTVDADIQPVQLPPRKPPIALRDRYKAELVRLVKLKVIDPVSQPTNWISSTVLVVKSSGKLQVCIDPKPLNQALKRSHYPLGTIEDILPDLANANVFTVADVKNGFWHVVLDEDSSLLTTFPTPWFRYKWLRMLFGISPAPEEFQRRLNDALGGLSGIHKVADDVLIVGAGHTTAEAMRDHDRKLEKFWIDVVRKE